MVDIEEDGHFRDRMTELAGGLRYERLRERKESRATPRFWNILGKLD